MDKFKCNTSLYGWVRHRKMAGVDKTGADEIVGTRVFSEKAMHVDQCCSILLNMYISSAPDKKR